MPLLQCLLADTDMKFYDKQGIIMCPRLYKFGLSYKLDFIFNTKVSTPKSLSYPSFCDNIS